jgi:hypothetical protein
MAKLFWYFITSLIGPLLAQGTSMSSNCEGSSFWNIMRCTGRHTHRCQLCSCLSSTGKLRQLQIELLSISIIMATRTKERELNIEPVCVGAHLYQPVELDYKSSPWRSDNVMILNSPAVGLSHIAELLNFTFLALILHTYPSDVRIVHSPLRYPLCQLLFTIHHFFRGLISFTF